MPPLNGRDLIALTQWDGTTKGLATAAQFWRLNQLVLLEPRDDPGEEPLEREAAREILAYAASLGLWQPAARGERGPVRWDSAAS
jgi:hypothetical protein